MCIIDAAGQIVKSYGGTKGLSIGQMQPPRHLAVDGHGNVLVADCNNDRVELLSPALTHICYLHISGYQLKGPVALHLDEANHRLYIGEWDGQRLFVLNVHFDGIA